MVYEGHDGDAGARTRMCAPRPHEGCLYFYIQNEVKCYLQWRTKLSKWKMWANRLRKRDEGHNYDLLNIDQVKKRMALEEAIFLSF